MKRHLPVLLLLFLPACGSAPPSSAPPASAPVPAAEAPQAARELRVPADLQKKWGVTTAPVERMSVSGALRLPGVLSLDQKRSAQVSTVLEGQVVTVSADVGDGVRKDQVLLVVHSPAFAQAQSAFLQSYSKRTVVRRELERATELLKDEAIQQKEYQRRQAEYEAASTEYALAESNLHSLGWGHREIEAMVDRASKATGDASDLVDPYLRVRAPIDGRVISRDVVVGEHVQPGKLLFAVSDLSTLLAILDAREQDLPILTAGGRVTIESQVYPGRAFEGRVARIGDLVDERLRTIKVRAEVPNPGLLLKPNMYIHGLLQANGRTHEVLGVPEAAVQTIEGEPSVFVVTPGKGFSVRSVQLGELVGGSRVIAGGLAGGETVVVAGAFNLKAELLKSSFAGE